MRLPQFKATPAQLRLDLTDRPAVIILNSIKLLGDRTEPIWSLNLQDIRGLEMAQMSITSISPGQALVTVQGADPAILLPLGRTVLERISSGSTLEIVMCAATNGETFPAHRNVGHELGTPDSEMADDAKVCDAYHEWYYDTEVWKTVTFLGVPCHKSVSDLWNYQEILAELRPQLVVEFGTLMGGSTLYFAEILKVITPGGLVLSVDIDHSNVYDRVRRHPAIELLEANTLNASVVARIIELRRKYTGPVFWIVDDAHGKDHVLAELKQLRDLTLAGDYVVVEDGNVNGHPILPGWGPGPYEALSAYFEEFPDDYTRDRKREDKFGFTFAPSGFLIRT
jgi:cephalosporin hydroxylase